MRGARDGGILGPGAIGSANLDTVLGLSMTPTTAGWVLVEGHDADGPILDHDDIRVRTAGGVRAVHTADRVAAAVLGAERNAADHDSRLHLVGVTWSDDAAAEAALLVESLTGAGFDNVVPVRLLEAVDELARGIALITGYERTAVCVLERESATVVLVGIDADGTRTTTKQVSGGARGLIRWLTTMFDRSRWQPDGVVVVGAGRELDAVTRHLEDALPVPVLTRAGAESALARGAALASVKRTQFTYARAVTTRPDRSAGRVRSRPRSYAGGLAMLGAGAATLVASLSLAVGLRLDPHNGPGPLERAAYTSSTPAAAEAVGPAELPSAGLATAPAKTPSAPPPAEEPPSASPPSEPPNELTDRPAYETPVGLPAAEPVSPPPQQPPRRQPQGPAEAAPPASPPDSQPLLTRLLERLHGVRHDPAPQQPVAPDAGTSAP